MGKGSPQQLIETLLNLHHQFYWERDPLSSWLRLYSTYITSSIGKGIPSAADWDFTQLTSPVLLGKGSPQQLIETLLNLHHQFYWERDPLSIWLRLYSTYITSSIGKGIPSASHWDFTQLTSPVLLGKGSPQHPTETLLNLHHQFYWERDSLSIQLRLYSTYITSSIGKGIPSASDWDFTQLTSPVLLGKGSPQHLIETLLNLHHQFYWERDPLSIQLRLYSTYITSSIGKGIPSASNWDFTQLTSPVLLGKGFPQHLIETLLNLHHQFYWERDPLSIWLRLYSTYITSSIGKGIPSASNWDFTQLTSPVLLGKGSPQHPTETLLNLHHQFYWERDSLSIQLRLYSTYITSSIGKGIPSASNWDFTQLTSPVLLGKGSPQHLIETLLNLHHQFYWERDPLSI